MSLILLLLDLICQICENLLNKIIAKRLLSGNGPNVMIIHT